MTNLEQAKQLAGDDADWQAVLRAADDSTEVDPNSTDSKTGYDKRLLIAVIFFAIWVEVAIGANLKNPQFIQQILYLLSHPVPALHDSDSPPSFPIPPDPNIIEFVDTQRA